MAQNPILVDQVQIEPGATGTRLIRKAADGSIEIVDAVIPGGITIKQLAGFQSVQNTLVVGKAGAGAAYTTVQAAIDAIPAGASELNPYTVLILPGVYKETITISRNGVFLVGLGGVYLKSSAEDTPNGVGANHTVIIQAGLGSIPQRVTFQNLYISNAHDAYACVRIIGGAGSLVGAAGIEIVNCQLAPVSPGGNRGVWATSINVLTLTDCNQTGDTGLSLFDLTNCAQVLMTNCTIPALQVILDSTGVMPVQALTDTSLVSCLVGTGSSLNPVLRATLTGIVGDFVFTGGGTKGNVVVAGDQTVYFIGANIADLALENTVQVELVNVRHSVITAAIGTVLSENRQTGTVTFVAEATKAVTFVSAHPDTNYAISVEFNGDPGGAWWVTNKTVAGFTINLAAPVSLDAGWVVTRF